jgi:hypothetical protein
MANVNLLTMRNPHGNAVIVMPGEMDRERDTYQCCHCGKHTRMKAEPLTSRGHYCHMCNAPHCAREVCWVCVPFEKKMEAYERRVVDLGTLTRMLL